MTMKNERDEKRAYIASIATAVPEYSADQGFAEEFMRRHFSGRLSGRSQGLLRTVFSHPSIRKRHFAFDDPSCLVEEDPDARVRRFTERSLELSSRAAAAALKAAGLGPADLAGIVVNTCTGYVCPGLSTYLIERLGMARQSRAYDMVGSGCGGAVPNLQVAEAMVRSAGGPVLSVSVEICSATFQMGDDLSLILSNALFGDGAAASVVTDRPEGWELAATSALYVPEQRETIRYVHRQGQLHNQLSLKLPGLVREAAAAVTADLLGRNGLSPADVRHWALHTGGEKIINAVRDGIGIPEERLGPTRLVLREYGNMSSPTVWFVLDEITRNGVAPGDRCVMIAYGAGLSAHACLLRRA